MSILDLPYYISNRFAPASYCRNHIVFTYRLPCASSNVSVILIRSAVRGAASLTKLLDESIHWPAVHTE